MTNPNTDIDLDFLDREKALECLPHVVASNVVDGAFVRHNTGIYVQDIPTDPLTGLASLIYDEAAAMGYVKLDFLNNSIYEGVRDEAHLDELLAREPPWDFFEYRKIVQRLAHIRDHFEIVQAIKPKSIDDLAVVLALIRPGKRHLIGESRAKIDAEIWLPTEQFRFKRSHAIAYAASIVVQLNLLVEETGWRLDLSLV